MTLLRYVNGEIMGQREERDARVLTRPAIVYSAGAPGTTSLDQSTYAVDITFGTGEIVRNVPIALDARELSYAEAGNSCRVRRSHSGRWEVTGFSKRGPGTYMRVTINVDDLSIVSTENLGVSARPLTYEEIYTVGPGYGSTPWGATGIFRGAALIEVR